MTFDCNDEWESFCTDSFDITTCELNKKQFDPINESTNTFPKCSQIYISTTTKISYLTTNIDIFDVFWKIPIISYTTLSCGAIKKQRMPISISLWKGS